MGALCFLVAIVLFVLAACGVSVNGVALVPLGLAFLATGLLLGTAIIGRVRQL